MNELLTVLQASGGVGVWVLVGFLWKFDRRLYRLELSVFKERAE